jgi:glycosyltransferase involved in cell wall biosynthesis
MKVAYLALGETYGSAHAGFIHTYNIVKSLSDYINIRLFIRGRGKTDIPTTFVFLPSMKNKNPIENLKSYKRMRNELKNFNIIHERFHINPVDLLFVKNKKYVLEVNDPAPVIYSGFKKMIYSKIIGEKFGKADAIITQTVTMKKILTNFFAKKIYVVPNGVDFGFFNNNKNKIKVRKIYKIPDDKIIITFAGAFREWHGVEEIVEMSSRMKKENPDVVFLLIGSGPLFEKVKKEKTENMILTGPIDYSLMPSHLSQSDILIAPFNPKNFSSLEKYGFFWCPMKLFEYMSSGRPIVSYDFPEVRNITRGSALLAKPHDIDGFIENILKLIENKKMGIKLGKNGKFLAEKEYDWNKRAEQIVEIYNEIS